MPSPCSPLPARLQVPSVATLAWNAMSPPAKATWGEKSQKMTSGSLLEGTSSPVSTMVVRTPPE
jgi:hypothetical protein